MIEKKINVEILSGDFEVILATDKGESNAEFEEEFANMLEQAVFEIPLMRRFAQTEKIKGIGVFEKTLRQFGLRGRECAREIRHRSALPLM